MAISFVGAGTAGTTTSTLPAHQADDLILILAFRDGSGTLPGLPAGYTDVPQTGGGSINATANSAAYRVGYKIAASGAETSGTWSNATTTMAVVYRGVNTTTPIGAAAQSNGSGTTVTIPALTLTAGDGSSWVVGMAAHRSTNTTLETPPTGMTMRVNPVDGTDETAAYDTNGGVSSWTVQNLSVGGSSSGWNGVAIELKDAGGTPDTTAPSDPTSFSSSNTDHNSTDLTWVASTDDVGVTGYDIDVNGTYNKTVTGTSTTVTGLSASTSYTLGIKAKDAANNFSNRVTTTANTTAAPTYPTDTAWTGVYPDDSAYWVPTDGALRTVNVSNNTELAAALTDALAGDKIVLADGTYSGDYNITKTGTSTNPITIMASTPGGAEFTGASDQFHFISSSYITVRGLRYALDGELFRVEDSDHIRIHRNEIGPDTWASSASLKNWIYIHGDSHHITVDYNTFKNKATGNNIVRIYGNFTTNQVCQYVHIHHNKFDTAKEYTENDKEPIRYGTSAMSRSNAYGVIERNYFANCATEPEIISMKTAYIWCIGNTMYRSPGTICYRHGTNGRITDNYTIDDNSTVSSTGVVVGGIRFYDSDHIVSYNYVQGAGAGNFESSLIMDTGDAEVVGVDSLSAHWRIVNATVQRNVIVNSAHPIKVGDNYSMNPTGCTVTHNITANTTQAGPLYYVGTTVLDSSTENNNTAYASTAAAGMTADGDGIYRLSGYGPRIPFISSSEAGHAATAESPPAATTSSIRVYVGGQWTLKPEKIYSGGQWVVKAKKVHNGSSWGAGV